MVFGDYDVDGVTSSFLLYEFFTKFLNYKQISIMYPDRLKDGYGLKNIHVDMMKEKNIDLIITVDNGITSVQEAAYVKELWMDLIITDHHAKLDKVPKAEAIINPQVSPDYEFKGICGAGVAFKLINAIMQTAEFSTEKKKQIFNYFLPIVTIATVADCVPLIHENRVMVKKWLQLINHKRESIPPALQWFLRYLNIGNDMDTYHIGFMIGPRINAGWRLVSPYESLYTLLYSGEKQLHYLEKIDEINNERKKLQEKAAKQADEMLNHDQKILIACDPSFHEWVVGIVAGRITEKHHKPSVVLHMNESEWYAVGSLRGPDYFNVVDMLKTADHLLERYGGHKQAWWLTVKIENLDALKQHFADYCATHIDDTQLTKTINVDTHITQDEREHSTLHQLNKLAPFGVGNEEPTLIARDCEITKIEKVGQKGKWHLKLSALQWDRKIAAIYRSKWDKIDEFTVGQKLDLIGKIKPDTFNGGYFMDGIMLEGSN